MPVMKSRVHRGLRLNCKLLGFVSISSFFLWQSRVLFFFKCFFISGSSFVIVKMMTLYTYDLTTTFVRMHARCWLTTKRHLVAGYFCYLFLFLVTFVNYFFIVAGSLFVFIIIFLLLITFINYFLPLIGAKGIVLLYLFHVGFVRGIE
jgi:hypothetical protein